MRVMDIMSSAVATCSPGHTLDEVASRMWGRDIGSVVVVDDDVKPIGVVTDRDICMAAYTRGCTLKQATAGTMLGRPLITCYSEDTLGEVAESMACHQVRRVPVVDRDGVLTGIVTLGDMARAHAMSDTAAAVLGMITTPRGLAKLHVTAASRAPEGLARRGVVL